MAPMDWVARYRDADTPWDLGAPHPELLRRLAAGELGQPGRAFVPGCGRAHDARALAEAGWEVTALDLVALETEALARLGALGGRYLVREALGFEDGEPYDLVLDHTFFCAIEPDERGRWGEMVARLLRAGGRCASLAFPVDIPPGALEDGRPGPPFRMDVPDVREALGAGFTLLCEEDVRLAGPGRRWKERWGLFERHAG